ncbi:hypothetical protein SAMN05216275_1601, partial [Streptosporangium canum]
AAMIRAAAVPATARIQEELAKSREQHAAMIRAAAVPAFTQVLKQYADIERGIRMGFRDS